MTSHHSKLGILAVVILVAIAGIYMFLTAPIQQPLEEDYGVDHNVITTSTATSNVVATSTATTTTSDTFVACTMDAKMCPDGTYVGRQGPKCEFSACPGN